jgi:glycosyltransferase involved in cell wall biosynthesis
MIIGRSLKESPPVDSRNFLSERMKMIFKSGPLFYAFYNIRLFIRLLIARADLFVANDLDTLPAVYLSSRLKRIPMVLDCHEYFTEVPELIGRPVVRKIWKILEAIFIPRIKYACTVSNSIADAYRQIYGITMQVVRNLPYRNDGATNGSVNLSQNGEKIIIYQGSLNVGRGLELAIRSMQYMMNTRLVIIGAGDMEQELRKLARDLSLQHCVSFYGRLLPDELVRLTPQADLGISLEERLGLSYYYALPNKLFDYIQARVPVLVSDLPEMAAVVRNYDIGQVTDTTDPLQLATIMGDMLLDQARISAWKISLDKAASELCWENEEIRMLELCLSALSNKR